MTARLLYHDPDSPGEISPFDEAIISIAKGDHVRLACPYLSLDYLTRIITLSASWRLLTDIHEWLHSQDRTQRERIYKFLVRNHSLVRHYPNLHSKVAIGSRSAMLGSANFTDMGIRHRTEVSILLEEESQIQELTTWFETHWSRSYELPLEDIAGYILSLPEGPAIEEVSDPVLFPTLPTEPARLVQIPGLPSESSSPPDESNHHERLIQRVGMSASRTWLEGYLDLVRLLLENLSLESGDPRLAMTIPKGSSGWNLPVSINNRYVLAPCNRKKGDLIGVIFGSEFDRRPDLKSKVAHDGRFQALPGENSDDAPFFLRFRSADEIMNDEELKQGWLEAARSELNRARSSPYRRSHVPACYRLVVDQEYRKCVLDAAFSSTSDGDSTI